MKKIYLLVLLSSWSLFGFSQASVRILEKNSEKPLVGATASLVSLSSKEQEFAISDGNGTIHVGLDLPILIEVRHLGYAILRDTIVQLNQSFSLTSIANRLEEVVVTGQFTPQSIDESVHTVKSISRQRIEAQGAIDLADVLSNNLNITLTPNKGDGRTSISMLGLDGQYVKILVDGVPFPSVDGNGNNVDITQLNLNSIERIEIVEGPMAVNYGANAFAGVINLITRSGVSNSVSIQEETVGSEYGFKQGRHIQSVSLGHEFKNGLTLLTDFQRNDFRGFRNGFQGEDHAENDGRRGYDWHPKLQYAGNLSLSYTTDFLRAKYRFSIFDQTLDQYSRVVFPDEHPSSGIRNPFALDDRNETERFIHNLSLTGRIRNVNYNLVTAYATVEQEQLTVRSRILTGTEEETVNGATSTLKSLTTRGNFTNLINHRMIDTEVGFEYTYESADGATIDEGTQSIDNLAGFVSLEVTPVKQLTIRPGLRTIYNSLYGAPLIYSTNIKYQAPSNIEVRASYGRSYRTPNITELFFFFVDANHNVTGNPDLNPEDGFGASLDIKKNLAFGRVTGSASLKTFYNDIQDQITLGVINENPLQFRYINVDRFKSKGLSFNSQFKWDRWLLNAGTSHIGRFNQFSEDDEDLEDFLFSQEININSTYTLKKPAISLSLFYKHTGRVEQYVLDSDSGEFVKGKTNAFDWLDFTSTWKSSKNVQVQGGVKNILNLRDIQTTSGTAGAHSAAPTSVGLTYGRSYFLRVAYNF